MYVNFSELLCSCTLPETVPFTCVVALLLCVIMRRRASYLYCFPTQKLIGADFTWGSNNSFIFHNFYFILLLLAFHPKDYIVLSSVLMNDYNKFNSRRRTIRIASEVAQTLMLPFNKEGIL